MEERLQGNQNVCEEPPAPKDFFESRADDVIKELNGKERFEGKKKEVKTLRELMDTNFRKVRAEMRIHKAAMNTTAYWKQWSKAVENGFLHYLDENNDFNRKVKGRGEVTLIHVKPAATKKSRKEDRTRGTESTEAERNIQQATRCEQFAFTLGLISEEKGPKQEARILRIKASQSMLGTAGGKRC